MIDIYTSKLVLDSYSKHKDCLIYLIDKVCDSIPSIDCDDQSFKEYLIHLNSLYKDYVYVSEVISKLEEDLNDVE